MSATAEIPPERLPGLVVETPRLILRRPVRADATRIAELANDVAVAENLSSMPHPYRLDDALAFVDNVEEGPTRWNLGLYLKDEAAAFVGMVGLMPRDGERHVLGYWIGRPYWNQGLATEAAQALCDHAFEALGAGALAATARVTNGASRRVLEKCGFQYAGQGMGPSLYHRGLVPIERFRLERSIWTSIRNWAKTAVGA
ncbi:MAG: GNAT family N-acetyltransferase [Phyllobacteriaceae bacterium]|nr:GNAT family N-acetyltransferase [Phyllobacteriaceae bacterium]